jgi:hypothetical protein
MTATNYFPQFNRILFNILTQMAYLSQVMMSYEVIEQLTNLFMSITNFYKFLSIYLAHCCVIMYYCINHLPVFVMWVTARDFGTAYATAFLTLPPSSFPIPLPTPVFDRPPLPRSKRETEGGFLSVSHAGTPSLAPHARSRGFRYVSFFSRLLLLSDTLRTRHYLLSPSRTLTTPSLAPDARRRGS